MPHSRASPPHRFPLRETNTRSQPGSLQEQNQSRVMELRRQLEIAHGERDSALEYARRKNALVSDARAQHDRLVEQRNFNFRAFQKRRSESERWKRQFEELSKKSEATEKSLDECLEQLRNMQLRTFQEAQKTWDPEEDSQVRELITNLYKSVRAWASTHSRESISDIQLRIDEVELGYLLEDMRSVTTITDVDSLVRFKYPFLIAAALLSEHIFDYIFSNPFFALDGPEDQASDTTCGAVLKTFFQATSHVKQPEAQKWRAQTLRLLFPRPQDVQPGQMIQTQGVSQTSLRSIYDNIGEYFVSGPAALLLRQMSDAEYTVCLDELFGIIVQAGNLYARVQTQSTHFVWEDSEPILGRHFSIASPTMRPDRFHRLEDEDDRSHDGKPVSIVLSPTVQVYGDHDGENFGTSRVVAKAVVYLDEQEQTTPIIKHEDSTQMVISP